MNKKILLPVLLLIALSSFIYAQENKKIALTFDADLTRGMDKRFKKGEKFYDPEVIKILKKEGIPCTIFLSGLWAIEYSKAVQAMADDSLFEFGNHSFSHPFFNTKMGKERKTLEIQDNKRILEILTEKKIKFFRFPGGINSKKDSLLAEKLGQKVIRWDIASGDAFEKNEQKIFQRVTKKAKDGAIVVFHLGGPKNSPKTAKALQLIIPWLKAHGYHFVKVSDLNVS